MLRCINVQSRAYTLNGPSRCDALIDEIRRLDAVLSEDLDVQKARGTALSPGSLAKSLASSFIPFEGLIREISGAHEAQKKCCWQSMRAVSGAPFSRA